MLRMPERVPSDDRIVGLVEAADPLQLGGLVARRLAAHELIHQERRIHRGDHGAVLRRRRVDGIGSAHAARARHVLHSDRRLPGNMVGEMARQEARVNIVAAADAVAAHDGDAFAFVEFRVGSSAAAGRQGEGAKQRDRENVCACRASPDRHVGGAVGVQHGARHEAALVTAQEPHQIGDLLLAGGPSHRRAVPRRARIVRGGRLARRVDAARAQCSSP